MSEYSQVIYCSNIKYYGLMVQLVRDKIVSLEVECKKDSINFRKNYESNLKKILKVFEKFRKEFEKDSKRILNELKNVSKRVRK